MGERILLVGPGAIGGMLAGYLSAAGRDVTVLARGETARQIAAGGIPLTRPDGGRLLGRPRVATSGAEAGVADIALFATKAFSLPDAMRLAAGAIGPDTLVVPVVNGVPWWFGTADAPVRAVDPDGALAQAVRADRLVGATVYSPSRRTSEGWVHTVAGQLTVGAPAGGASAAADRVAALFDGTGYRAVVTADVRRSVWTKLVTNATFNPLCALTGARQCDVAGDDRLGPIALAVMREIEALAIACGSGIDASVDAQFRQAVEHGVHKPSTLQDFEAGRPVELAALVDAPLELAERVGLAMPNLRVVASIVRVKAVAAGLLPR